MKYWLKNFNNTKDLTLLDEQLVKANGFFLVEFQQLQIIKSITGELARQNVYQFFTIMGYFRDDFEKMIRIFLTAWEIEFSEPEIARVTYLYCTEENFLRIGKHKQIKQKSLQQIYPIPF